MQENKVLIAGTCPEKDWCEYVCKNCGYTREYRSKYSSVHSLGNYYSSHTGKGQHYVWIVCDDCDLQLGMGYEDCTWKRGKCTVCGAKKVKK